MTARHYTLFETAIGWCGIVWGEHGVTGVRLPEADAGRARARLLRRFAGAVEAEPPAEVRRAAESIAGLLGAGRGDLTGVALDMAGVPPFNQRVYEVARSIPAGDTMTYGEVAARLGDRDAARDVGQALGENPFPIVIPCHRVVATGGKLGGFSATGGAATKRRLLTIEGAAAAPPTLFDPD